ncbi:hypothetical protein MCC10028_0988 [Bifidobacterium longum subsp. longum]|uniref:hypothetical protein n=2 Tax=Bifidobacterium longum TaxID=216816 RepID=UPI0010CE3C87|nr:hypothetical protein [Bifidobacterium longum]TCE15626.1 hypothetical protein MCC10028_0988 [Bifidobacterium longum subsp. longum]UWG73999.1 MAG: hypothetical protein [Bacteriophage sp.]
MAELVTGHAGKAHATAEQAAGLNAGILGLDDYVLNVHDKLKITVVSANKVTIGTGELVMQGRHVSQGTPEDLIVTNGSQGQKRNDLIVCRYAKGSQNIESAKLVVVRGTPTTGTPTDPAVNTTSPLDGGTTYDMPLYRIPLDGITIGTPVALFNVLKPMSDVWDSLTQRSTTWRVPYSSDSILLTRIGDICFMGGNVKFNSSGQNNYTKAQEKLPEGYRPVIVNTPVAVFGGETTFICYGDANGTVTMLGNPNSAYAGCTGVWRTADPMPAA